MSLQILLHPIRWQFRFPFRIAHGLRSCTDAVILELRYGNFTSFGEATLPPYLPDTQQTTIQFLENLDLSFIQLPLDPAAISAQVDKQFAGYLPAKAALDMALWNLKAQLEKKTVSNLFGIISNHEPLRSYTISICDRLEMQERLYFGQSCGFSFFKLKMDGKNDEQMLRDFRSLTDAPFAVDVNQGWQKLDYAMSFSNELIQAGCLLIEQPFHKSDLILTKQLRDRVTIPIIADEACQRLQDIATLSESYSGINIKLQKCGGISEAYKMIELSRTLGLKVLIGCMSESMIGCQAAEALAPLCDWNDLDGPWLITNNDWRK